MKTIVNLAAVFSVATLLLGSASAFASAASAAANLGFSAAPPMPYGWPKPPVRIYKPAPRQAPKRS
jgi:Spy/CpxP family protein refolding chaperone